MFGRTSVSVWIRSWISQGWVTHWHTCWIACWLLRTGLSTCSLLLMLKLPS